MDAELETSTKASVPVFRVFSVETRGDFLVQDRERRSRRLSFPLSSCGAEALRCSQILPEPREAVQNITGGLG